MKRRGVSISLYLLLSLVIFQGFPFEVSAMKSLLPKEPPGGWALTEGPKNYTRKNLFERINGQAELFFKYGYQRSISAIYRNRENSKNQIELDVYDMGNVLQAFGIFSRFRNDDRSAGIGLESYLEDQTLLFYKGKYFAMVFNTESDSSLLKEWASPVSTKIPDPSPAPREIRYFPKEGLKPGSIQYHPEGLLGYQFLKRGFQATYLQKDKVGAKEKERTDGEPKEIHLFLAIYENSGEAMRFLKSYRDDLSKKGKRKVEVPAQFGPHALKGEDPYKGKIIIAPQGLFLLGVLGFEEEEDGIKLLEGFRRSVK